MRLSFREYGTGRPPLVILHGLFGSGDNWHTIAKRLESKRHVFALDLRNHGQSPHSEVFTFPAMASDVVEFLDAQGLSSADVLGHSLGGKVAMELALSHPDRVRRLVIVDISPKSYHPHHVDLKDAMLSLDLGSISSRKEAERALAERITDRSVRLFLLKNLALGDNGRYRWRLNLAGIAKNFSATGAPIAGGRRWDGPVMFLRGGRSDYVDPSADEPRIRELFPRARIETIKEATHWVHADQPEAVVEAIEGMLAD